jgi:UDP-glucose:(heptosyl)LPS alpha-1,3-glucosyltransferase
MKIALVNHLFSLHHGGLERFSVNLATSLTHEGHEVHAFGQSFADLPPEVEKHPLRVPRKPAPFRLLLFQLRAASAIQKQQFDIIYGLTRFHPVDIYRMGDGVQRHWLRLRYSSTPWRWLNCLVNPMHLINLWFERNIFQDKDCRIVTNSRLCREHAQAYYGVESERIKVIYNGVDHHLFDPERLARFRDGIRENLRLGPEDIAVLHVSNNWHRKGLAVMLEAISLLGQSGKRLHLVVVGRGRPASFLKLACRLGLEGRLHIVGPSSEVEKYYRAADLMVLPTIYDPFANVCLEAMACALPVITTAQNGASELIKPGENGFVQKNAADSRELAALLSCCLDHQRLKVMGAAARNTARPFTRERNQQETMAVFSQVLGVRETDGSEPRSGPEQEKI